ncbi:ATP-binding protein [Virgibacillus pantothenticus]|uniref:ATP-binding protein n=1 Tax=Virgibacillus pantothenticus TaxID=1473 RepID=UPI0025B18252|nr:ATP-binding protein [Virgibacillus pantothenticus]
MDKRIAKVESVLPDKIKIRVYDIEKFKADTDQFTVGSYLRISDHEDGALLSMIENFSIEKDEKKGEESYILEAAPVGFVNSDGEFIRGGNNIAIPPTGVERAQVDEIKAIYNHIESSRQFLFSTLLQNKEIPVPIDGNKFFNKHIAVVGSTGSGKSHTVSKVLQKAIDEKSFKNFNLKNHSRIVLFDLHDEYRTAFPSANHLNVENLKLPYWLMNGEELEELFVESGENQSYNQSSLLRHAITLNKKIKNQHLKDVEISFDTSVKFSIQEVINCIINLSNETRDSNNPLKVCFLEEDKEFDSLSDKMKHFFKEIYEFKEVKVRAINKGVYNDGTLEKFKMRLQNKFNDKRLSFLFKDNHENIQFEDVLKQLIGSEIENEEEKYNIFVIDLSGVPFEVLSITVSLISRLLFDFSYIYKRMRDNDTSLREIPLLLVYEEAHKYVPKMKSAKYNSSRNAIERIAKEGRKYGISAMIVSQRPSEISETIFSQCSNFIAMRLTNPEDQNYIKRLLPDVIEPVTSSLPTLREGEAIIIGDSITMPSLVKIDSCNPEPSSQSVEFLDEWKEEWYSPNMEEVIKKWIL